MVLAWTLSRETNGIIQKTFIVVQVATLAGAFGIQTSLYYFLPRIDPGAKRGFITQSLAILGAIGTACSAIIYLAADPIAQWMHEPAMVPALRAGAITAVAALTSMIADPLFIAEKRAWLGAANAVGCGALQVLLVALALKLGLGMPAVFLAVAVASLVRLLSGAAFAATALPPGRALNWNRALFAQQVAYILPIGLISAVDTISSWLDRTLVSRFYDSADLAVYTYGAVEIPFISIVIGSIAPVLLPHFSARLREGRRDEVLEVWHRATRKGAAILFGMFFLFLCLAPEFLTALYSHRYRDSALYFRIYLALLPFRVVAYMPMLFALGRNHYVMVGAVGEILLNLVVSLFLILKTPLGMAGAACGTVISTLCQAAFYLSGIRAGLGTTWSGLLPWRPLARDFAWALGWFAPLVLLKFAEMPSILSLAAGGGVYAAYSWFVILPRLRSAAVM